MQLVRKVGKNLIILAFLTVVTQVGGLVYLLYKPIGSRISRRQSSRWKARLLRWPVFLFFYLMTTLWIVPPLAERISGRVPMPLSSGPEIPVRPAHPFYWLANRHYVKPKLKDLVTDAARKMADRRPELKLLYLDAGFPFGDPFPLLPHRSHDDGEKIDLAFFYSDRTIGRIAAATPAWLGYGHSEGPLPGEANTPADCAARGYWQYRLLTRLTPAWRASWLTFAEKPTADLLRTLAADPRTGKLFLEPHLKQRLGLSQYNKIRFHGCAAVRHDDHIHLQL